tara:strand:+ start:397 stop:651 length:255 start_codon:yes stop_codon:yes gene_type:complete
MTDKEQTEKVSDLIARATVGNLNASFIERLSEDGREFIKLLEVELDNGKDISPRTVSHILADEFNDHVAESTISKWKSRIKRKS